MIELDKNEAGWCLDALRDMRPPLDPGDRAEVDNLIDKLQEATS